MDVLSWMIRDDVRDDGHDDGHDDDRDVDHGRDLQFHWMETYFAEFCLHDLSLVLSIVLVREIEFAPKQM